MSKLIPLSRGLFATVDDADFDWLNQWKWHASPQGRANVAVPKYRAVRNSPKGSGKPPILMHRIIVEAKSWQYVDHRNGNPLDNRRDNLRLCTQSENCLNSVSHADALSPFKGVSWSSQKGKWHARLRSKHIGFYETQENAARAYDRVLFCSNPSFAKLNFPMEIAQ